MRTAGVYDYQAIYLATHGQSGVPKFRLFNGPNWNPPHLLAKAERLYEVAGVPIAWCMNPARFGWGEPGLTWWCRSIVTYQDHICEFVVVDGQCQIVRRPARWQIQQTKPDVADAEHFDTFDDVLNALWDSARRRRLELPEFR